MIVVSCDRLGKLYVVGERERYTALRDVLTHVFSAPFRRLFDNGHSGRKKRPHVWAIKDICLSVRDGETLGIIGRNGAGKSTLLKVLSRITEPTEGTAIVRGRLGSLLEVGTGFHPELTGRENIFLSGAILGMSRADIRRRFDEIVAFAEIEPFIDTPAKRYSSGMYTRLGFAVAAHLEPDTLLVDEVLAVGDMAFQRKCLNRMGTAAGQGRTVVFVSHQMNQIRRLCSRCVWIETGSIKADGPPGEVIGAYEKAMSALPQQEPRDAGADFSGTKFLTWEVDEGINQPGGSHVLYTTGPVTLRFTLNTSQMIANGHHGVALYNSENQLMWAYAVDNLQLAAGRHTLEHSLPGLPVRPGVYWWHVSLYDSGQLLDSWYCLPEMVVATPPLTHMRDEWQGLLNFHSGFSLR